MARAATAAEAAVVVAYMAVAIGGASRQAHRGEGGQGGLDEQGRLPPLPPPRGVKIMIESVVRASVYIHILPLLADNHKNKANSYATEHTRTPNTS